MFNTHICKNCFNTYSGKPEVCPHCGFKLKLSKEEKQAQKSEKKKNKRKRLTDQEIMDTIDFNELVAASKKSSKAKEQKKAPDYTVDKSGNYCIDTTNVTYLPNTHTYSAKKARGEHDAPKIKWWEIYKWADLFFARRKIKKEVKKASYYRPEPIKKGTIISLCVFFGWCGGHNLYARHYRKTLWTIFLLVTGCCVVWSTNPALETVKVSIGGGSLFVVLFMWMSDLINLIINKFSYKFSRWKFIDNLNADNRATLGRKYIDINEYKKPWYVRLVNKIVNGIKDKKAKKQTAEASAQEDLVESTEGETAPETEQKVEVPVKQTKSKKNKNKKNSSKKSK